MPDGGNPNDLQRLCYTQLPSPVFRCSLSFDMLVVVHFPSLVLGTVIHSDGIIALGEDRFLKWTTWRRKGMWEPKKQIKCAHRKLDPFE